MAFAWKICLFNSNGISKSTSTLTYRRHTSSRVATDTTRFLYRFAGVCLPCRSLQLFAQSLSIMGSNHPRQKRQLSKGYAIWADLMDDVRRMALTFLGCESRWSRRPSASGTWNVILRRVCLRMSFWHQSSSLCCPTCGAPSEWALIWHCIMTKRKP